MFVAVLFVLFKRKMQRKKAQKISAENRYILNKNCSVFFAGRGSTEGASPLCKGTGSAASLCRSRAAAIAQ